MKNGAKTTVEKLFETSDNSFATQNLKSAEIKQSASDKKGPLILGAAGTYNGEGTKGQFVVVGSSSWIANSFLRFNGNRDLFLNSIAWLSADEDLISIRPKNPEIMRFRLPFHHRVKFQILPVALGAMVSNGRFDVMLASDFLQFRDHGGVKFRLI